MHQRSELLSDPEGLSARLDAGSKEAADFFFPLGRWRRAQTFEAGLLQRFWRVNRLNGSMHRLGCRSERDRRHHRRQKENPPRSDTAPSNQPTVCAMLHRPSCSLVGRLKKHGEMGSKAALQRTDEWESVDPSSGRSRMQNRMAAESEWESVEAGDKAMVSEGREMELSLSMVRSAAAAPVSRLGRVFIRLNSVIQNSESVNVVSISDCRAAARRGSRPSARGC